MSNSLYELLRFVAPVTIQGKAILRELTAESSGWDVSLPQKMEDVWITWSATLTELSTLSIPKAYTLTSPLSAVRK